MGKFFSNSEDDRNFGDQVDNYREMEAIVWKNQFIPTKPKKDNGPMIMVKLEYPDGAIIDVAASKTEHAIVDSDGYSQISKQSPIGEEILANEENLKEGDVLKTAGAKILAIDRNFIPPHEE